MPKRPHQPGLIDGNSRLSTSPKVEPGPTTPKRTSKARTYTPRSNNRKGPTLDLPSPKKIKTQASKPEATRIKAGLDYGTTNSAVAWAKYPEHDASNVEVITSWPGGVRNNERLEKVPSRYAFAFENATMSEDSWGYGVPPGSISYAWTKLLLDSSVHRSDFDSEHLTGKLKNGLLELPEGMTAQEVATAYLEKLHDHAMLVLKQRNGESTLKITPIDWWLTVPATWNQRAVAATRAAAEDAGFGSRAEDTLSVITEPEAAGVATLSKAAEENPGLVQGGTNALIADLGGGTLDFQILTVVKKNPSIQTEEAVAGIAGKSGSTYIDCQFHTWMVKTFGEAFTKLPAFRTGHGSKFMIEWENTKIAFNGCDLDKKYQINLPALGNALREAHCEPEEHEIKVFFDQVLEKAFKLVEQQISCLKKEQKQKQKLDLICLCGGAGESTYVWKQFDEFCSRNLKGDCELFTDKQAWSAVVRGAVIRGLNGNSVLSKKAKRCYGIGVHQPFREGIDRDEDRVVCPVDNAARAEGYIAYFIMLGNKYHQDMKYKIPVSALVYGDEADEDVEYQLYSCPLNDPPNRIENSNVESEGVIPLNLSSVAATLRDKGCFAKGVEKVSINIYGKMGEEKGMLSIEAWYNKRMLGKANLDLSRTNTRVGRPRGPGLM